MRVCVFFMMVFAKVCSQKNIYINICYQSRTKITLGWIQLLKDLKAMFLSFKKIITVTFQMPAADQWPGSHPLATSLAFLLTLAGLRLASVCVQPSSHSSARACVSTVLLRAAGNSRGWAGKLLFSNPLPPFQD